MLSVIYVNTASTPSYGYGAMNREPADGIREGMKYKELKYIYHYGDWRSELGDKHNPAVMGWEFVHGSFLVWVR